MTVLKPIHLAMFAAAFLVGAALGSWNYWTRPVAKHKRAVAEGDAPVHKQPVGKPLNYTAAPDRKPELQAFDKCVQFVLSFQEEDGHWDAAKSGAAPEFQGPNGDIVVTALAAHVLLMAAQEKKDNAVYMTHVKKAMDWLVAKVQPDGRVADLAGGGEPVTAQMTAAMTFLLANTLSTRDAVVKASNTTVTYALLKMGAKNGGFGSTPNAEATRADLTALGIFIYRVAVIDGVAFSEPTNTDRDALEKRMKAAIELLRVPGELDLAALKNLSSNRTDVALPDVEFEKKYAAVIETLKASGKLSGAAFKPSTADTAPQWGATCAGLLAQMLMIMPEPNLSAGLEILFGLYDRKTESYPLLQPNLAWGKGELPAFQLWQGSLLVAYRFGEGANQRRHWEVGMKGALIANQKPDGGWDVAGEDAKRGRIWRAAFNAFSLMVLTPAPPQPPPPDPVPADGEPAPPAPPK